MGFNAMHLLLAFLPCTLAATATATAAQTKPGCQNACGNVPIPYPFGTREGCYRDEEFLITCSTTTSGSGPPIANLTTSNIQVLNISLDGELRVLGDTSAACYNASDSNQADFAYDVRMWLSKFAISNTKNKFTVVGCDTYAYIKDNGLGRKRFQTGCMLICDNFTVTDVKDGVNGSCSGVGCCQTTFPEAIKGYEITLGSYKNHTFVQDFNPCSYAFVVENGSFNFSSEDLLNLRGKTEFPVVLNWVVENKTCAEAMKNDSSYACKENSECQESGLGYLCKCKQGFQGNPYLSGSNGCQDVDECRTSNPCNITWTCQNTPGNYSCSCPPGYTGDGYKDKSGCTLDNQSNKLLYIEIALGISVGLLVLITLISTICWVHKQRTLKQLREQFFEKNGGFLLQDLLSQLQVYGERTKIFTQVELEQATNNFHESRIVGRGGQGVVYKGILPDNMPVAIKKSRIGGDMRQVKDFINEVAVLSQINHRNVVKLLGCCLETEIPLLVYEFVSNGTLLDHIDPTKNESSVPWDTRLRIAVETAEAVSYLHSAASIPIIHRDIKSTNILLDHDHRAKVSDFGASRLVPLDQTQATTLVQGTLGYLDPEYLHTGQLNGKSDVYSFGVVLVELLTGKKAVEFNGPEQKNLAVHFVTSMREDRLMEILDRRVLNQNNAEQLMEVALLARRCIRLNGEERPSMKEVAMELESLIAMEKHPWVGGDVTSEENEYLLGHVADAYRSTATSNSAGYDSLQNHMAFETKDGR